MYVLSHLQVRDFQSVIGRETRAQCLEKWNGLPDIVMACVGGGSNAMGIFNEFVDEESVGACCPCVEHALLVCSGLSRIIIYPAWPCVLQFAMTKHELLVSTDAWLRVIALPSPSRCIACLCLNKRSWL